MKAGTKRPREIVNPMSGVREAPITRLMSPGDLGERLKPFVFLDQISVPGGAEQQGAVSISIQMQVPNCEI